MARTNIPSQPIPPQCNDCDHNGNTNSCKPGGVPPMRPGVNYSLDLDSFSIPENLCEYFLKALDKMGLTTIITNPLSGPLKAFFEAHRYGDYNIGQMLLAFCIIIDSQFKTRDYKAPIIRTMKDHLERSGYAAGGTIVVDVFFMEVL